jgi:hypothetical protein
MNYAYYIPIFLILILVPVVMAVAWTRVKKRKRKREKLRKRFEDFAIKNNLSIDKKQIVRGNMIGIDRLNFKLVFLINSASKKQFHLVDMRDLLNCSLKKDRDKVTKHISKIYLQCQFEKGVPDINFVFFDESKDDPFKMMRSFKKASYWKKCIDIFTETANLSGKSNRKIAV